MGAMTQHLTGIPRDGASRSSARFPDGRRVLYAALCWLLVSMCCLGCTASSHPATEWQLNKSAQSEGWRVTVLSLSALPADPYRQPLDGHIYVAVQLKLENESPRTRYVMPEQQMTLFDGGNNPYSPDPQAAVIAARALHWLIPEGEFAPGAVGQGAISYQVPIGTQDLRWVFRTNLYPRAATVTFVLGDAPRP
jgi:hypothetical protein